MKKILFALAIMPLLVMGCSSDDVDELPKSEFDHDIELLYGQWRATAVEIMEGVKIDLTDEEVEKEVPPTYVTFEKNGAFSSEGVLGNGKGTYTAKGKKITTVMGDEELILDMTSLKAAEAKIVLNAKTLGLPSIPEEIKDVTVVLTKQVKK
ncbi:MAG: hypothetical protein PHI32_03370 [Dysgonamonadaceae bacterium]|nr:hypothetical protein [Dysgonamonadaceae bacterium]MDD4728902.1 hypothetical protein [Dysgonamonadaceae bacterium]